MHPSLHLQTYRTLICPIINTVCMLHFVRLSFCFPTPVNTPLHEPLHIVDNERRCSTSNISNALPVVAYSFLVSVLLPLPIVFLASLFSIREPRRADSQKYNNTAAAPTCASVLFDSSSAAWQGMR